MASLPSPLPHIAIFPFLSKGHTIPLLHLARLLHRRRLATLTFLTTPLNAPFLRRYLAAVDASIIELPFPRQIPGLLPDVQSTDHLPSMDLFLPFVQALKLIRPDFERAIEHSPVPVDLLISDGFYGWTNDSAIKLSIPRLVFYGMNNFALTICSLLHKYKPHAGASSVHEPFMIPGFPDLWITKGDLDRPFDDPDPSGPLYDFVSEQARATRASQGIVANSFYELEAPYLERWNAEFGPKAWCVGPLCFVHEPPELTEPSGLVQWLAARNRPVLYVAFGSQADVSPEQIGEIAAGLDRSGLDFIWVVRSNVAGLPDRFGDRGLVVREWVDQPEILRHAAVRGFMSHCGWNSASESIAAGVPLLAWPMMAEQRLNAKLIVEQLKIGLRLRADDAGLVKAEEIEKKARELLTGEEGKAAAARAERWAAEAKKAMGDGGSSWVALENMIKENCGEKIKVKGDEVEGGFAGSC